MTIFTPQERRVLLFLLAALLAGSGVKLYRSRSKETGPHPVSGSLFPLPAEAESSRVTELEAVIGLVEKRLESPGPPDLTKSKININRASQRELCVLPGIGTKIAGRIVEYREAHGLFEDVDQLRNVPGIGEKKLSQIRKMVKVRETIDDQSSSEGGLGAE